MKYLKLLLVFLFTAFPATVLPADPAATLEELGRRYSDETCKTCHERIYKEWKESFHSQSVVHTLVSLRTYIEVGIKKEWNRDISKADLMKCFHCHAPQFEDAAEGLAIKVGELVVTAMDEGDQTKRDAAKKELSHLNVNCVVCHNTVIHRPSPGALGKPAENTMYGPKTVTAPHKTAASAMIKSPVFCGQCHGSYSAPDHEVMLCNTLYDSYQSAYIPNGGRKTCQDCHMKEKNKGHTFPGAYVAEQLKEGLEFETGADSYKYLSEGKWLSRITVNINIFNRAGHRTPDG